MKSSQHAAGYVPGLHRLIIIAVLAAAVAFAASPRSAAAADFRSGDTITIPAGQVIDDDLYVVGTNVDVAATVNGDVYIAAQTASFTGTARGSVWIAGQTVTVGGTVGNSLKAAGQYVNVSSRVTRDVMVAGQVIAVEANSQVGTDLYAAGTTLSISSPVGRNAGLAGESVSINSAIRGNVDAEVSNLVLGPSATVGGNLRYVSNNDASVAPGATVAGVTERRPEPTRQRVQPQPERPNVLGDIIGRTVVYFMGLVVGIVIILLAPAFTARVATTFRAAPGWALLAGLIAVLVTPIVAVALLVSIIGIPLAVITFMLWGILLYVAPLAASLILARLIPALAPDASRGWQIIAFSLGLFILTLVTWIPILGGIIGFVAALIGAGAIAMTLIRLNRTDTALAV